MNDIDLCRMAFEHRHPDAIERAKRIRDRFMSEAKHCLSIASQQMGAAESGIDWRYTGENYFVVPIEQAVSNLDRASDLLSIVHAIDDLMSKHCGKQMNDGGPTTELVAQVRKGKKGNPVARLVALDHITADHARYATEIAAIVQHVSRRQGMKTMNWPTHTQPSEDSDRHNTAAEAAEWMALLHSFVYLPWADRVRQDLALILGLVVDGDSLSVLARRHGVRWANALVRIKHSLDEYGRIRHRYEHAGPDATGRVPFPGVQPMRSVVKSWPHFPA